MENNQERKLGAGIITMSVIHLVIYTLAIIGLAINIFMNDTITQQLELLGADTSAINPTQLTISLILSVLMFIAVILILCKKAIGVYAYFIITVIDIINTIITSGFNIVSLLISLIFPTLMGFFIYKKKYVFGFKSKEDDLTV